MKGTPQGKVVKATPVPEIMIEVERSSYIKLVRKVRDLEATNDKLEAYMKVISEAARESQTRNRIYSQREQVPAKKRIQRGNGKSVQGRNTGQVLRGKNTVPVGGVQVPIHNSTPYKPNFCKSPSKTKLPSTTMVKKGAH